MSNRDNGSELDYYELRRRHQEYKSRMRAAQPSQPATKPAFRPAPAPVQEEPLEPDVIQDAPADIPAPTVEDIQIKAADIPVDEIDIPQAEPEEKDPLASFVLEEEEEFEEELDYEDDPGAGANPFDSFIRFFNGVKDNIAARREAREEAELDALDEDLTDEELAELDGEFDDLDELEDDELEALEEESPKPARRSFLRRRIPEEDELDEDELDEDFDEEDLDEGELDDEDLDDEDFDDELDDAPRKGGLQRFLGLFISRVEDEELEEYEEIEPDFEEDENVVGARAISESELLSRAHSRHEGGRTMDEMNKPVPETIPQMAEGLEPSGMTRRERRERAMRLAAEEAARKAAEEAARKAAEEAERKAFEEAQKAAEPVIVEEIPAAADVIKPLFVDEEPVAPAVEPESEPVEEPVVEEPTREFTPVNLRTMEEDKQDLFELGDEDEDDEEDFDDEDFDDEDDDEDDEDDTPRRGFFAKLRGRKRDEDDEDDEDDDDDLDDDDDYDDDEDDDEDDDDEDERPAKSRRGLFGFLKKANDDDDDDDDEDDEDDEDDDYDDDDEDDEDEDEEYDEYEDDDEYDSYDDDRVHRSIGYHIIGVLKWVLRIIFVLLVCVIALNFLYVAGNDTIVPAMHDAMGDTAAFHLLFFGYDVRQLRNAPEQTEPAIEEPVEDTLGYEEPEQHPEPEIAIPDLDSNGEITESPIVDVAPVSEDDGVLNIG